MITTEAERVVTRYLKSLSNYENLCEKVFDRYCRKFFNPEMLAYRQSERSSSKGYEEVISRTEAVTPEICDIVTTGHRGGDKKYRLALGPDGWGISNVYLACLCRGRKSLSEDEIGVRGCFQCKGSGWMQWME
jgi:hypothetical protein